MCLLELFYFIDLLSPRLFNRLDRQRLHLLRLFQLEVQISVLALCSFLPVLRPHLHIIHIPLLHESCIRLHLIDLQAPVFLLSSYFLLLCDLLLQFSLPLRLSLEHCEFPELSLQTQLFLGPNCPHQLRGVYLVARFIKGLLLRSQNQGGLSVVDFSSYGYSQILLVLKTCTSTGPHVS